MNIDRRVVKASNCPSDDSGSDSEENLRVSRSLKTFEQVVGDDGEIVIQWPSVCKVIPERIKHVKGLPNKIEMFYDPNGRETQIQPIGEEYGVTVYNNDLKCDANYFTRSLLEEKFKQKFKVNKDPIPRDIQDDSLLFESRFESGNLMKAIRITDTYYELRLRSDLYTSRHCQWFYFRIKNMRADVPYRFSFVNFGKPDSQYSVGMKPVMYSEIEAEKNGIGWTRSGTEMTYFREQQLEDSDKPRKYIMSFVIQFPHDNDTVYLSHCYPYRYSDMMEDLNNLRNDPVRSKCFSQKVLCQTLAGNDVPILTVTSPKSVGDMKNKQVVIITSRVHPGESPSSWIMRGVIHYLTADTEAAEALRKVFVFKIVPMLNPDGVIVGNTRCNLAGSDLNRQYKHTVKEAYPTVFHVKELISKLLEDDIRITLYCDLHAHSRKYNIFMYGCENRKKSHKYLKEQIFPYMLHKNAKDRFNFEDCRFTITRAKEATGRIVFKNMGIMNSYTLEASYGGSNCGNKAYSHFTPRDYENVGRYFCETLLDFNDPSPPKEQLRYKILLGLLREKSSATDPSNIILSEYSSISSSEGEYTDVSDTEWNEKFLFQNVKKPIRRKLRKKSPKHPFLRFKHQSEDSKPHEEFSTTSESESSSDEESYKCLRSSSARASLHSFQEKISDLSEISEDEDAIQIDVMREFRSTQENLEKISSEFSASACERIHSELLASVNQIYMNLQDSGLKTNSSSSSSLSGTKNKSQILKTKSIELKSDTHENEKKARSMSIAEITLKKKVTKKLKSKKVEQEFQGDDRRKAKHKEFVSGQMEVFIKPKKKTKRNKRQPESEP